MAVPCFTMSENVAFGACVEENPKQQWMSQFSSMGGWQLGMGSVYGFSKMLQIPEVAAGSGS